MKRHFDYLIGVPLLTLLKPFSKRQTPPQEIKKLLIIKLAAAGDTILLIPVIRSIKKAFPHCEIHWLVSPINSELASLVPYVDQLHLLPNLTFASVYGCIKKLRSEKFDACVDFEQWARGTALLSYFSGAPVRYGFDTPHQKRTALYTKTVEKKSVDHESVEFYCLAELLGPLERNSTLELWETEEGRYQVERVCQNKRKQFQGKMLILLHPGCGVDGGPREWPLPSYALLGNWLMNTYQAQLFISAGPDETVKARKLNQYLNKKGVDMGGKLTWQGSISLCQDMDFVISGNTGMMHLAAALGKKQIALHGPTDPRLWGPLNEKAIVLQSPCPVCPTLKLGFEYNKKHRCMNNIDLATVKSAFQTLKEK